MRSLDSEVCFGRTLATAALVGLGWASWGCAGSRYASAPARATSADWQYDVAVGERSRELRVDMWLPPGSLPDLVVGRGAEAFVQDVAVETAGGWKRVPRRGTTFGAVECAGGCHLRYRFALRRAAEAFSDADRATAWGDLVEAPASTWLLRPMLAPVRAHYRLHVATPADQGFETGTFLAEDGRDRVYQADASTLGVAPYSVFGPIRERRIEVAPGVEIDLVRSAASLPKGDAALTRWATESARTIARFFGCFPVARAMLLIAPVPGDSVRRGETMGDGGASVIVEVGEKVSEGTLASDWILPHEMTHLAVPSVSRSHHWLEEGLAVYFEPIARARLGIIPPEQVWLRFAREMPSAWSAGDTTGLDGATDWRRTYWGGALFCLLADLEIRRRTGNRLGLDDAVRGLLTSGGSVAEIWPFDRVLSVADSAVGLDVLRTLYGGRSRGMGRVAWRFDLPMLFRDLGVGLERDRVTLFEDAPLAAVRRAITAPVPQTFSAPSICPASPLPVARR